MEVAEGFLVGTDEEDAHHVVVVAVEGVEGDGGGLFAGFADEAIEDAFAVAGDVGDDGLAGGFFVKAVEGGDGEELVDRPDVGEALEHGEIAVVEVG